MTNKKSTKKALLLSVLALLLCCSMLVGTTFAWFTDEVTSGKNTITAGNLDIELEHYKNGEWQTVNNATDLFTGNLWEPGHTEVVYLKLTNLGTLSVKYQLAINIWKEVGSVNVYGEDFLLSDYLQYKVFESDTFNTYADRKDAVAALKDADGNYTSTKLNDGYVTVGHMLAGEEKEDLYLTLVVTMPETVGNEANYKTGEAVPTIDLGIKLLATQYTHEEDSFGPDYDDLAFVPVAEVNPWKQTDINATLGMRGNVVERSLDTAYQFLPTETYEEAVASGYGKWHADYVVTVDKDIKAGQAGLAGYYSAWCDQINNGYWVALEGADLNADTPIRLVQAMGGGSITVNYEEICKYGIREENSVNGFLCGAWATEELAGMTMTVELRLYETLSKPHDAHELADGTTCSGNTANCETGEYITIGTYTYTVPAVEVSTMAELDAALEAGVKEIDAKGANLGDFYYDAKFTDGAVIKNAKFTYFYGGNVEGTVTFENCEFVSDHSYSANFDSGNGNIIFNNCLFDGWSSFGTAITNVEMNGCTFQKSWNYGMLRFYQTAQLNNCTFSDDFDGVDTNVTGYKVELTDCTGIEGKIYNNGSNLGIWVVNGEDISAEVTSW